MSNTEEGPPAMEVLIPSLPNKIALNILARVPRQYHAFLSAVSKPIRSVVSSPEFFAARSLLNRTESILYLRLGSYDHTHDHWYAVHRNPNPPNNNNLLKFAPVPQIPVERQLMGSAYAAVGPKVYVLGGSTVSKSLGPSSDVWVLDCRTHRWERGPSMLRPRFCPSAAVVDGKVYVVGGRREKLWVEVLDPDVGRWEAIPCPLDGTATSFFGFKLIDGKIFIRCGRSEFSLDPTTKKWEEFLHQEAFTTMESGVVDVDGVSYRCICSGGEFEIFGKGSGSWKELKGVAEGKPKYVFCHRDDQTLLNLDGRLVVVFSEVRFGDTIDLKLAKVGVWGAEIDVTENGDGDWLGQVHWSEKVPLLPELTFGRPEEKLVECMFIHFRNCLSVPL